MKGSLFLAGVGLAACLTAAAHAQSAAPASTDKTGHHKEAPKTRAEVEARVKARFLAMDANKDGFITPDELHRHGPRPGGLAGQAGAKRAGGQSEGADRLFAMMDKDGNGQISKAEFEAFHADHAGAHRWGGGPGGHMRFARWGGPRRGMEMMHMRREMMVHRMFEREDADHDGKISLAEAEKAALDRFDKVDTNHDGVISDAERAAARQQMAMRFREHRWGGREGWGGRGHEGWGRDGQDHKGDTPSGTTQG